jgi:hypothetical protein
MGQQGVRLMSAGIIKTQIASPINPARLCRVQDAHGAAENP